eukprot:COSAG01_NODE_198_length_22280_cov_21.529775_31_plen_685_part_00
MMAAKQRMAQQQQLEVQISAPDAEALPSLYNRPVLVWLFKLETSGAGEPVPLAKRSLLGADGPPPAVAAVSVDGVGDEWPRVASFVGVLTGHYTIVAFVDVDGSGQLRPHLGRPQPLGWLARSGGWGGAGSVLHVCGQSCHTEVCVALRHATPPLRGADQAVPHGTLGWRKGCTILHLRGGSPYARGLAQGRLLARLILDFLEFYIIEDAVGGPARYAVLHAAFASRFFAVSPAFAQECEGIVEGIIQADDCRSGGVVLSLGRVVDVTDIVCLNAPTLIGYTLQEWSAGRLPVGDNGLEVAAEKVVEAVGDGECTQFCGWNHATAGTDVDGGTIIGRNMDGECDVRRVTVTHFLLLAVDPGAVGPGERSGLRYISALWPGAVGVQTGLNSAGLWAASNAGSKKPAPFGNGGGGSEHTQHPLNSAAIRNLLTANCNGDDSDRRRQRPLAAPLSATMVLEALHREAAPSGGIRISGQCMMIGQPYQDGTGGGMVYEGDHTGGAVRFARGSQARNNVPPYLQDALVVANHNMVRGALYVHARVCLRVQSTSHLVSKLWLGCEAEGSQFGGQFGAGPAEVWGVSVSFSSLWRYQAGASRLSALRRAGVGIGTREMKGLLQTVTAGMTEHSIVANLNTLEIEVAFCAAEEEGAGEGSSSVLWDAPYSRWHAFHFDDLFIGNGSVTHTKM